MKKEYIGLIGVVVIVLVVLSSFVLYNQWPLVTGEKIVLATQPVDPFDPLRGQYMTIRYEISRFSNEYEFEVGDVVYVSLEEDGEGIWRKVDASLEEPKNGDFIKGKVVSIYQDEVRVEYGIEQFFFERGADLPTENITVEIMVSNSGRGVLSEMLHEGEPVKIEYEEFDIRG